MYIRSRSLRGGSIAELPVAIWLLMCVLVFPMIVLGTMTLRYTFLSFAAASAAKAAALQYTVLDAKAAAAVTVERVSKSFSGLSGVTIKTTIIGLPEGGQSQPISPPSMQVSVTGTLDPIISIPGVIGPFPCTVVATEVCAHPDVFF